MRWKWLCWIFRDRLRGVSSRSCSAGGYAAGSGSMPVAAFTWTARRVSGRPGCGPIPDIPPASWGWGVRPGKTCRPSARCARPVLRLGGSWWTPGPGEAPITGWKRPDGCCGSWPPAGSNGLKSRCRWRTLRPFDSCKKAARCRSREAVASRPRNDGSTWREPNGWTCCSWMRFILEGWATPTGLCGGCNRLAAGQPSAMCSTPLEVAGLAQLAGCFEADLVGWMEWPDYSSDGRSGTYPFALAEQMLQTPLSIEQGELILPEGPGLGVKVNEAVIRRFPYRTGPCSSFQPTGA